MIFVREMLEAPFPLSSLRSQGLGHVLIASGTRVQQLLYQSTAHIRAENKNKNENSASCIQRFLRGWFFHFLLLRSVRGTTSTRYTTWTFDMFGLTSAFCCCSFCCCRQTVLASQNKNTAVNVDSQCRSWFSSYSFYKGASRSARRSERLHCCRRSKAICAKSATGVEKTSVRLDKRSFIKLAMSFVTLRCCETGASGMRERGQLSPRPPPSRPVNRPTDRPKAGTKIIITKPNQIFEYDDTGHGIFSFLGKLSVDRWCMWSCPKMQKKDLCGQLKFSKMKEIPVFFSSPSGCCPCGIFYRI